MKNPILSFLILTLIISIHSIPFAEAQYLKRKAEMLPSFEFNSLNGEKITDHNLKNSGPLLFFYMSSTCEECRNKTAEILKEINIFQEIRLVIVSPDSKEELQNYIKEFNLESYEKIIVLQDTKNIFPRKFRPLEFSSMYFYGNNQTLLKDYEAGNNIQEIKNFLSNNPGSSSQIVNN